MFDLGDEFVLNNHKVPWLIWIQILVMFLLTLIILFSYFGFFVLDSSSSSSPCNSLTDLSSTFGTPPSCSPTTQGNNGSMREVTNAASNRARCLENTSQRDGSSIKDLASSNVGDRFFHPCRYFSLAKQAFLKCLGLGSSSLNFPDKEHDHED